MGLSAVIYGYIPGVEEDSEHKVLAPTPMPPPKNLPPEFAVTFNFDKRTQLDFVNNITINVLQDSKKIEKSCITSETLR